MSTIWTVASIILPAVTVAVAMVVAHRAGISEGLRRAEAPHPDTDRAIEQLGHAVLDMSGAGAEEIRLVRDSKCGQWTVTGLSRHPMGEGGNG